MGISCCTRIFWPNNYIKIWKIIILRYKWYIPCTCLSVTGDVPGRGVWGERSPRPRDQPSLPGSTSLKVEQIESWAGLGLCHCAAFSLTPHLQPARSSVAVGCWPHVGCTILLWPVATRQRLAKSGNGWASPLKTGLATSAPHHMIHLMKHQHNVFSRNIKQGFHLISHFNTAAGRHGPSLE